MKLPRSDPKLAKPSVTGPHGDRLTPRRSFELWVESVRGLSMPWTRVEIAAASRLYAMLERCALEDAVRAADRQKDVFIATLAHELRNPLAPISTSLGVLESAPANSTASSHARRVIDRQIRHMVRLIDDLLDVSRVSRGRIELRREPVDVHAAVERAIEIAPPSDRRGTPDPHGFDVRRAVAGERRPGPAYAGHRQSP